MIGNGSTENSEDFSMEDPVCIDGVIFYGAITDREKLVKERFERRQKEKVKTPYLPPLSNKEFPGNIAVASEESKNDISFYESFSIDESIYESFNDSLDERKFLNPNEVNIAKFSSEQINVNKRKCHAKQMLKGSLCDSLEDIHSLVSNVEKLSISEEIENINVHEKNNIYDDSLKNDVCLDNKNFISIDQNFDDDSLAILDFEKGFDDSLEEADFLSLSHMDNVVILRNGENNTEISVENISKENAVSKNLFEASVEVIFENAGYVDNSEEENAEVLKQLSLTADSLSISENISKDSLDGSPYIPKYLEQKSSKRSSNTEKFDKSRNSQELEYCGYMKIISKIDSNSASDQNLPLDVKESGNEEFTNIKRNNFASNNTIVSKDSFIKSSDTTTSIQSKISMKGKFLGSQHEKDFSSQINDSFGNTDCSKLSSYSTSKTYSSVVNNTLKISDESIKKSDIHPNDTICIDDSFTLPPTTSPIKNELHLIYTQVSGNNEPIHPANNKADIHPNDTICIDDSFILPQITSFIEDELHLTDAQICGNNGQIHSANSKADIHPNNTICIDDSIILPQNSSFIKDELHPIDSQVSGNDEPIHSVKNNSTNNSNSTIFLNNSILNMKSEKSTPKEKYSKMSINSKFYIQNPIKPEKLISKIYPNDTISIDNSFNLQENTPNKHELHSFKTQASESQNNNFSDNPKLNVSADNSFTMPSQPFRNIKSKKNPSSLKKKKEKYTLKEDSKSYIHSPIKHQSKDLEKNNEAGVSKINDTINIDSSPDEPIRMKMDKRRSSASKSSKKSGKIPSQDKNISSKFHIQSPTKHELQYLKEKNEARDSNLHDAIYIDGSPAESLKMKLEVKGSISGSGFKAQSPKLKNDNDTNQKQFASHLTAKVLDSPLEEFTKTKTISSNIIKDPKIVIDYFKDALVLPKDLPKDSNLKLQLEVVFDENQGVNIISVSSVDQCTKNITPAVTKVNSKGIIANHSPDLSDENKGVAAMKNKHKICESSFTSKKIPCKGHSPDLPEVKSFVTKSCPEKDKTSSICTNNMQSDSMEHNVQLLEALDLHDTSCSLIDKGFLQSRDSIIPLNLCIRNKSPEPNYQFFSKTESKENIPFFGKALVTSDHSKSERISPTIASNKTPKHLNWNTDVKKSGSKSNSITKIPVRKIDIPFFTPVHQKVSKDINSVSSSEKIPKNPLVKSISATDNLSSAKPQETPRKHHFCSVRNSISKVPKSTPRSIPKKFQNIESPVAKYIGKSQMYTPLKTTHRYDGNLILGNAVKSSKQAIKTPNNVLKRSPQCSSAGKL